MCGHKADFRRAALLALSISLSPAACFAQAATIVVDASQTVAQSDSGDDLATLQNIFQAANAPPDGIPSDATDSRRTVITDLKMKRMRILQGDTYCDLDAHGAFGNRPFKDTNGNYPAVVPGDCDLMKWQIDWALTGGLTPHVAVGYSLPVSFVQFGAAQTWTPATLALFQSYAQQLVNYVAKRSFDGGASSVVFEVNNELDIAEPEPLNYQAWLKDPKVGLGFPLLGPWGAAHWWWDTSKFKLNAPDIWSLQGYPFIPPLVGDGRRVTLGIGPMQKIFAAAVVQVQQAYPGKITIAGPAFAGNSFAQAEDPKTHAKLPTLDEQFLDYMYNPNIGPPAPSSTLSSTQLDYVSFHYYGDFHNGWKGPTTAFKYITDRLRTKLATIGHPEAKLFLSEWGPSSDLTTDINYSHKGAAWAAAFLTETVADHVAMGSYLIMDDAAGSNPPQVQASLLYKVVTNGVASYYPKPATNVFKMFAMMTGTRRAVTLPTGSTNLGAFAASDANSAGVVIFNYDYSYAFADTPQTFSVELDNLPLNGVVTVERYLVDANTSNLEAYLNQSTHPDPHLQKVEQLTAQVVGGKLTLPARTLGLGVTFWRILH